MTKFPPPWKAGTSASPGEVWCRMCCSAVPGLPLYQHQCFHKYFSKARRAHEEQILWFSPFRLSFLSLCPEEMGAAPMPWSPPPTGAWEISVQGVKTEVSPFWSFQDSYVWDKALSSLMDSPGVLGQHGRNTFIFFCKLGWASLWAVWS